MKRLILVRHAKSDWAFNVTDFERPLNHRGHENAPEMAERLKLKNMTPDMLVTSPAKRALTTATYFLNTWKLPTEKLSLNESIYEASTNTLLSIINNLDNNFDQIALFGHNPGITSIVNYLTNSIIDNLPTCSVTVIDFEFEDWQLISAGTGNIFHLDYPKLGLD